MKRFDAEFFFGKIACELTVFLHVLNMGYACAMIGYTQVVLRVGYSVIIF